MSLTLTMLILTSCSSGVWGEYGLPVVHEKYGAASIPTTAYSMPKASWTHDFQTKLPCLSNAEPRDHVVKVLYSMVKSMQLEAKEIIDVCNSFKNIPKGSCSQVSDYLEDLVQWWKKTHLSVSNHCEMLRTLAGIFGISMNHLCFNDCSVLDLVDGDLSATPKRLGRSIEIADYNPAAVELGTNSTADIDSPTRFNLRPPEEIKDSVEALIARREKLIKRAVWNLSTWECEYDSRGYDRYLLREVTTFSSGAIENLKWVENTTCQKFEKCCGENLDNVNLTDANLQGRKKRALLDWSFSFNKWLWGAATEDDIKGVNNKIVNLAAAVSGQQKWMAAVTEKQSRTTEELTIISTTVNNVINQVNTLSASHQQLINSYNILANEAQLLAKSLEFNYVLSGTNFQMQRLLNLFIQLNLSINDLYTWYEAVRSTYLNRSPHPRIISESVVSSVLADIASKLSSTESFPTKVAPLQLVLNSPSTAMILNSTIHILVTFPIVDSTTKVEGWMIKTIPIYFGNRWLRLKTEYEYILVDRSKSNWVGLTREQTRMCKDSNIGVCPFLPLVHNTLTASCFMELIEGKTSTDAACGFEQYLAEPSSSESIFVESVTPNTWLISTGDKEQSGIYRCQDTGSAIKTDSMKTLQYLELVTLQSGCSLTFADKKLEAPVETKFTSSWFSSSVSTHLKFKEGLESFVPSNPVLQSANRLVWKTSKNLSVLSQDGLITMKRVDESIKRNKEVYLDNIDAVKAQLIEASKPYIEQEGLFGWLFGWIPSFNSMLLWLLCIVNMLLSMYIILRILGPAKAPVAFPLVSAPGSYAAVNTTPEVIEKVSAYMNKVFEESLAHAMVIHYVLTIIILTSMLVLLHHYAYVVIRKVKSRTGVYPCNEEGDHHEGEIRVCITFLVKYNILFRKLTYVREVGVILCTIPGQINDWSFFARPIFNPKITGRKSYRVHSHLKFHIDWNGCSLQHKKGAGKDFIGSLTNTICVPLEDLRSQLQGTKPNYWWSCLAVSVTSITIHHLDKKIHWYSGVTHSERIARAQGYVV